MPQLIHISLVMALCFAAWGFFYIAMHRRWRINYVEHFVLTTIYFLIVAALLLFFFWPYFIPILMDFSAVPIALFGFFIITQTVLHVYLPRYVREPKEYFKHYPDRYFLKIHWHRLISKSADILAQQVFIILLVVLLKDMGLALHQVWLTFGILFLLLHLPLILGERGAWPSWLFLGIVAVFSIIFPTFILFLPYGFVYNMLFHWLFYTLTATIFWFSHNRALHPA